MGVGDKLNWVLEELNTEIEKGHVEVKGLVSDAEKIAEFEIADIFMMLSHNEVIPISILEAMSASCGERGKYKCYKWRWLHATVFGKSAKPAGCS